MIFPTERMVREWRVNVWVSGDCLCECVWVFFFLCKNLHSDLIWSALSLALLRSEMIGKTLSSLRGDEQRAQKKPPGPPRFLLWSEVMNWSDILVLDELGLISSFKGPWVKRRFWSNHNRRAVKFPGGSFVQEEDDDNYDYWCYLTWC